MTQHNNTASCPGCQAAIWHYPCPVGEPAATQVILLKEDDSPFYLFTFRDHTFTQITLKEIRKLHAQLAAVCDSIGCPCFEAGYEQHRESTGYDRSHGRA